MSLLAAPVAGWAQGGRDWRGAGDFDPAGFLARLDANGNGQIDPEEAEGRGGFFLRRMAENNPNLDLSKPIPLDRLNEEFARMRQQREAERIGGPTAGGSSSSSGPSGGANGPSAKKPDERLVPGFGEPQNLPAVPGFGLSTNAAALVVRIIPDDRAQAQRRLDSNDNNKDGRLDQQELGGRYGEYQQYDRNKDGVITIDELALRYATRRVDEDRRRREAAQATAAGAKSSSGSSASGSTSSASGLSIRRPDERERGRDGFTEAGRSSQGGSSASNSRASYSSAGAARPYRVANSSERLAKLKLPGWFLDKDKDEDGQVAMAEFGGGSDFARYDLNGDGLITPEECVKAAKSSSSSSRYGSSYSLARGPSAAPSSSSRPADKTAEGPAAKPPADKSPAPTGGEQDEAAEGLADSEDSWETAGADDAEADQPHSSSDSASSSPSASSQTSGEPAAGGSSAEASSAAALPAEIDPRYLAYAQGRIKQADANGDGLLQPEEWAKMPKPPAAADFNGDKQITAEELAAYLMKQ